MAEKIIVTVKYPKGAANIGVDVTCNRYTQFSKCCGPPPWTKNVTFTNASHYIKPRTYNVTFSLSGTASQVYSLSKSSASAVVVKGKTTKVDVSLTKKAMGVVSCVVRLPVSFSRGKTLAGETLYTVTAELNGVTKTIVVTFPVVERVYTLSWDVPPRGPITPVGTPPYYINLTISGKDAHLYKWVEDFGGQPLSSRAEVPDPHICNCYPNHMKVVAGGFYNIDNVSTRIMAR